MAFKELHNRLSSTILAHHGAILIDIRKAANVLYEKTYTTREFVFLFRNNADSKFLIRQVGARQLIRLGSIYFINFCRTSLVLPAACL